LVSNLPLLSNVLPIVKILEHKFQMNYDSVLALGS